MEQCESRTSGVCARVATWKQSVHAGGRPDGRIEYYSHWCDEHAAIIAERRRINKHAEATMARITQEVT